MKRSTALLVLIVLLVLAAPHLVRHTQAAAPAATFPDATSFLQGVHSGKLNPETYDFDAAGLFQLPALERANWQGEVFGALLNVGPQVVSGCAAVSQQNGVALAWVQVASQSKDAADWKANVEALRGRLAEMDQELTRSAPAKPSNDPLVQELLARFARDQDVRVKIFMEKKWTDGLPKVATDNWLMAATPRMTAIDCDNTAWLKQQLPKIGWFTIPKYGEEADTAAWHLVQHADREPAFQREMLDKLQALPPGHTDRKRIGYLFDRVARAEGRPQRYGTQGTCKGATWEPHALEDPDRVDEYRASLGMKPESAAIAANTEQCTKH